MFIRRIQLISIEPTDAYAESVSQAMFAETHRDKNIEQEKKRKKAGVLGKCQSNLYIDKCIEKVCTVKSYEKCFRRDKENELHRLHFDSIGKLVLNVQK